MTTSSSITITYDGVDITSDCIFKDCTFEQNAGAIAGQFQLRVKDLDRTHSFTPGKEVVLTLDGKKLFGGVATQIRRTYAFPVVDTSVIANVQERIWEITGADYNIWLDRLVLRNESNYKKAIEVSRAYDGNIIRNTLATYFDLPAGFDTDTEVHNIIILGTKKTGKWAYPTQGATLRQVLESMRVWSGATYWVDANKKLHWEPVGITTNSWGLTDKPASYPANQMIPCREVTATQDGAQMVTDALIWSGNQIYAESDSYVEDGSGLFFARFPNPPANNEYRDGDVVWTKDQEEKGIDKQNTWGRWQKAEQNFGSGNSARLGAIRARTIVLGPGGTAHGVDGGLGQPLWDITASWFGHDVPGGNHVPAGYLMNIIFWGLGTSTSPLVQYLPTRHVTITFPTIPESPVGNETYVKFTGRFGTNYSDHRKLWKQLKAGRRNIVAYASSSAVASSFSQIEASDPTATPATGAFARLPANIDPVIQDNTTYETGHAYIPGTLRVYLNGLYQRPGIEYYESTPGEGEITFYTPLLDTDEVFIEFRAAGDAV